MEDNKKLYELKKKVAIFNPKDKDTYKLKEMLIELIDILTD